MKHPLISFSLRVQSAAQALKQKLIFNHNMRPPEEENQTMYFMATSTAQNT